MLQFEDWCIEEGQVKHLHTDGEDGTIVTGNDRVSCNVCRITVPTMVLKMAERSKSDMENIENTAVEEVAVEVEKRPKKNGKAKNPGEMDVAAFLHALENDPAFKAEVAKRLTPEGSVAASTIPSFEIIPAAMIYFTGGRPDHGTREFLKSRGFTFRNANPKGENRHTWVGPLHMLKGTPFEIAE